MMKTHSSRLMCMAVVLAMIIALLCPIAVAENEPAVKRASSEKHAYTFIGDSIPSGFSLRYDTQWNSEVIFDTIRNAYVYWKRPLGMHQVVPASYPALIGEALGIKSDNQINSYYNNLARCGVRTQEILRFMDSAYNAQMAKDPDDEGNRKILNEGGYTGMTKRELEDLCNMFNDYVANSKLVTLEIGSNDVAHAVLDIAPYQLQKVLDQEAKGISVYALLRRSEEILNNGGDLTAILLQAVKWAEQLRVLPETLAVYSSSLITAASDMLSNYQKIINKIYDLNKDCTLVVVGAYNPFADLKLTDIGLVKVGRLMDGLVNFENTNLKSMSPNRNFDYRFADVSDVKLNGFTRSALDFIISNDFADFNMEYTETIHPGQEGHRYIADQILKVLGDDFSLNLPEEGVPSDDPVPEGAFRILVASSEGGAVNVVPTSAKPGETISVQVASAAGFHLKELYYYGDQTPRTSLTPDANGFATFAMPSEKVTVTASFESDNAGDPLAVYTDVNKGDWFYDPVKYVVTKGYMAGTSASTFRPNDELTRAMVVQILYAIKSKPPIEKRAGFTDAPAGEWYYDAVSWAADKGIVAGFEDNTFRPNQNVTREELATMLRAFTAYSNADTNANGSVDGFSDAATISGWAVDHIKWAVGHQIMAGKPGNLVDPKGTATRAEMATMIYRLMSEVIGDRY